MASRLAAVTGILEGFQDYQDSQRKRQMEQIDLMQKQQQLAADQRKDDLEVQAQLRSQKADENAAAVLQGIYGGANPQAQPPVPTMQAPPPQQMAPGQPSVPMQQPGQRPPLPPGGPQGQMPPQGQPPLPPGQPGQAQARPQQPPAPPPYQRIDTQMAQRQQQPQPAPPQQPPQAQIPAQPPAPESLTFDGAVKMLQAKGVQGPALVDALDRIQPYLNAQAKQQADMLKQQITIQKAALDAARLERQGQHDAALEANANARLALEQQRLGIEASRASSEAAARSQAAMDRAQAREDAKIPAGYEKDPAQPGAIRPMKNGPYDPNGANYRGNAAKTQAAIKANQTVAERMNPTMLASVKLDISEGRQALDAVSKLNTSTTGPYYAHDNASPVASLLHRELTSDQQQQYETLMNRMAVAIASVQSMGRGQISDAKVNEARKLVPQLGDTPGNRARKIAQLHKIFDMADDTLKSKAGGNPAEPDADRESATTGSVPGGGNQAPPKTVNWDDLK